MSKATGNARATSFGFSRIDKCFDGLWKAFDDVFDGFDFEAFEQKADASAGDVERVEETETKPDGTVIRRVITRKAVRK